MRCQGLISRRLSVSYADWSSNQLSHQSCRLQRILNSDYKPIFTYNCRLLLFILLQQCFLLSYSNSRFHCHNTVAILDSLVAATFQQLKFLL